MRPAGATRACWSATRSAHAGADARMRRSPRLATARRHHRGGSNNRLEILLSEPNCGISAIILLIIAYVFHMYPEGAPCGEQIPAHAGQGSVTVLSSGNGLPSDVSFRAPAA